MSRHSRVAALSSSDGAGPQPPQSIGTTGSMFGSSLHPPHQTNSSSLERPSAIPSTMRLSQQQEQNVGGSRKPAVAYTGLTGAGYTLSGHAGRFLLPEKSVARAEDAAGTLDVWPAGKSALSASSAANKQERKRQRNRSTKSSSFVATAQQHDTTAAPKLLQELDHFVQSELDILGAERGESSEPNAARLQVYREAFRHFMEEFRTYKPFLSAVKNEYDSVLDKYARRLHYIPALRARLSTMEASTKQQVRREADVHAAEIRRIKIAARATEERLKSLEILNQQLIDDNVKVARELDLQRTRYLDMKTANVSIVASLKKKDLIINEGQGAKQDQEDRAAQLANQLEQLEIKHDVVHIQLANLRTAHAKATSSSTHQNVERLEAELEAMHKEQGSMLQEHRDLSKRHSETLALVESLTEERQKLAEELEREQERAASTSAERAERASWLQKNGESGENQESGGANNKLIAAIGKVGTTKPKTPEKGNSSSNSVRKSTRRKSALSVASMTGATSKSSARATSLGLGASTNGGLGGAGSGLGGGGGGGGSISRQVWTQWIEKCLKVGLKLPPEYKTLIKKKSTVVSVDHVAHLVNGLLATLENGSFVEEDSSKVARRQSIRTMGARGVPIAELRRLMKRLPPWTRKKDGKAETSDVTSVTSVTTQQNGDHHKEPSKLAMFYFVGRGIDPEIPKFLRFNGRVRNRHMSKADIERIVKIVWIRKEQSRNKDHLSDFFHTYLQDEFGPSQTVIAEQAYNIVHALERYSHDADCDMFLKILMGDLPEQSFVDQQLLLQQLKVRCGRLSSFHRC